ncbi:DUF6499 domain-containing protein [Sphingomonas sp. QA11]|uniref:transcriptional regulator domain-containing protein n=1 Tax=Sphingomonas sp. QA11 TaxID=2950605 RepID=UPI002349B442|nr:DUF6499 domain-containing protein [Sphingomonas sp. QA11]WCM25940.1 DUF6499 domain-containing protein [Sphingomonas sp. QA11]
MARTPSARADALAASGTGVTRRVEASAQATFPGDRSHDPAAREAVARFGRSALAWEILRRNPLYRADADRERSAHGPGAASPAFVARWGLHFR